MSTDSKHLVILAAGTGGHVMPGLAVAKVMASRGWKISWVGTVAGMERGLVERHGIPFHALDFQGVRGRDQGRLQADRRILRVDEASQ